MRPALLIIGAAIFILSLFGYMYAEDQQSLGEQAEDIIGGDNMDWALISALSLAGVTLGIVLVALGLVPEEWYEREGRMNRR